MIHSRAGCAFLTARVKAQRLAYDHNGTNMTVQVEGTTRLNIDDTGDVKINNGNLVMRTAGHGIDFSATANSAGSMSNELLSDYEEEHWTPVMGACTGSGASSVSISSKQLHKNWPVSFVSCILSNIDATGTTSTAQIRITELPFTSNTANSFCAAATDGISFQGSRTFLTTE